MGREVDVAFTKSQWMKTNKTGRAVRDPPVAATRLFSFGIFFFCGI